MDSTLLEEIGLAKSEILVYSALLKSGSIKVGDLMKRVSLHRSRLYEAINRLIDKGLVSYIIKNNVKYFEATDPERLLTYIEEQKERLTEKETAVKKTLPELKRQVQTEFPDAEAHVFYGKEGFKTIRKDVLKQKQTLYLIGAIGREDRYLQYFFPNFNKLRTDAKIPWKILYDADVKGRPITKLALTEARYLPKEYASPAVINIYADRVVNVLWKDDTPICFMIINKGIADSYRKWFAMIWKHSSPS